jgi:hypothetical protein
LEQGGFIFGDASRIGDLSFVYDRAKPFGMIWAFTVNQVTPQQILDSV